MKTMTPDELKQLIASDPTAKQLADTGAADRCAERCMEIARVNQSIPADTVQREMSITGSWARVNLAREKATTPEEIKGVCITIIDWIKAGRAVDITLPAVRTMIATLKNAGLVTAADVDSLIAHSQVAPTITGLEVSNAWPFAPEQ